MKTNKLIQTVLVAIFCLVGYTDYVKANSNPPTAVITTDPGGPFIHQSTPSMYTPVKLYGENSVANAGPYQPIPLAHTSSWYEHVVNNLHRKLTGILQL